MVTLENALTDKADLDITNTLQLVASGTVNINPERGMHGTKPYDRPSYICMAEYLVTQGMLTRCLTAQDTVRCGLEGASLSSLYSLTEQGEQEYRQRTGD